MRSTGCYTSEMSYLFCVVAAAVGLLGSSRSVSTWNLAGPRTRAGGVHSVADKHNDHTTINRTLPSSLEEDELVKVSFLYHGAFLPLSCKALKIFN